MNRAQLTATSGLISTAGAIVSTTPRRRLTLAEHRRGAAAVHAIDDALGTPAASSFSPSPTLDAAVASLSLSEAPAGAVTSSSAAFAADPLGPLPEGWGIGVTVSGRTYFIDHAERKTTWHDPRKAAMRNLAREREREARRLRAEAEVRRAAASGGFAPAAPSSSGATDAQLEAAASVTAGHEASPEPSSDQQGSPSSVAATSSTLSYASSDAQFGSGSASYGTSPTSPTTALLVPETQLGALPSGWERRVTPTGRPYFVDHNVSPECTPSGLFSTQPGLTTMLTHCNAHGSTDQDDDVG